MTETAFDVNHSHPICLIRSVSTFIPDQNGGIIPEQLEEGGRYLCVYADIRAGWVDLSCQKHNYRVADVKWVSVYVSVILFTGAMYISLQQQPQQSTHINYAGCCCKVWQEVWVLHKAQRCEDSHGDREFLSGQGSALLMPITTGIVNSRHCTEAGAVR